MFVQFPEALKDREKIKIAKGKMETKERVYLYPITKTLALAYRESEKEREEEYLKAGRMMRKLLEREEDNIVLVAGAGDLLYVLYKKGNDMQFHTVPKREEVVDLLLEDIRKKSPQMIYLSTDEKTALWFKRGLINMRHKFVEVAIETEDRRLVIGEKGFADRVKTYAGTFAGRVGQLASRSRGASRKKVGVALMALATGALGAVGIFLLRGEEKEKSRVSGSNKPNYTAFYRNLSVLRVLRELDSRFIVNYDGRVVSVVSRSPLSRTAMKVGRLYVEVLETVPFPSSTKPRKFSPLVFRDAEVVGKDKGCTYAVFVNRRASEVMQSLREVLRTNRTVRFSLSCADRCVLEVEVCPPAVGGDVLRKVTERIKRK